MYTCRTPYEEFYNDDYDTTMTTIKIINNNNNNDNNDDDNDNNDNDDVEKINSELKYVFAISLRRELSSTRTLN